MDYTTISKDSHREVLARVEERNMYSIIFQFGGRVIHIFIKRKEIEEILALEKLKVVTQDWYDQIRHDASWKNE